MTTACNLINYSMFSEATAVEVPNVEKMCFTPKNWLLARFGNLLPTASKMSPFVFLFISVAKAAAVVDNNNNNNTNTNVYDERNDVDCVAVNSTTKCRSWL